MKAIFVRLPVTAVRDWLCFLQGRADVADYKLKQTEVTEDVKHAYKLHAVQNRQLLQTVYDEAVADFLKSRAALAKEKKAPEYKVPSKGPGKQEPKPLNVRIREDLAEKAEKASADDGISDRRLIYTALIDYAKKNKLVDR